MRTSHQSRQLLILKDTPWIATLIAALTAATFLALGVTLAISPAKPGQELFAGLVTITIFIAGVLLPLLAIGVLLQFTSIEFDRSLQTVEIRRRKLLRSQVAQIQLSDVRDAYLEYFEDIEEEEIDGTIRRTRAPLQRPVLRLHNRATEYPLRMTYSNTAKSAETVDVINAWLEQK